MFGELRSWLYNTLVTFTAVGYRAVLADLPENSLMLDIGIGTGAALLSNRAELIKKHIHVVGIDLDEAYVRSCAYAVRQAGMEHAVTVRKASILEFQSSPVYDAIYFSGSFMLVASEDKGRALEKAKGLLKPDGLQRIYFTQTHEVRRSSFVEFIKPKLKYFLTVDFGKVTYENEFKELLTGANLRIISQKELQRSGRRAFMLTCVVPAR